MCSILRQQILFYDSKWKKEVFGDYRTRRSRRRNNKMSRGILAISIRKEWWRSGGGEVGQWDVRVLSQWRWKCEARECHRKQNKGVVSFHSVRNRWPINSGSYIRNIEMNQTLRRNLLIYACNIVWVYYRCEDSTFGLALQSLVKWVYICVRMSSNGIYALAW